MSKSFPRLVAAAAIAAVAAAGAEPANAAATDAKPAAPSKQVARGEYLVTIMGCTDCHTPLKMGERGPEPDLALRFAGHPQALRMPPAPQLEKGPWVWVGAGTNTAFAGPWGVSFSANLTPDRETGLGTWTEATFVQAMRTGRHEGQGRPILPPMPAQALARATDEDLAAVFAYLQSLPAVSNRVPQPVEPAGAQ